MSKEGTTDMSSFTNFSIEETSMLGDQSILDDLLEGDSVAATPDKVETIKTTTGDETTVKTTTKVETTKKPEEEFENPIDKIFEEEEEEEDPIETTTGTETTEKSIEGEEVNQFAALAKDLFKLGVFSQDEEEDEVSINNPEEFLERFKYEGEKNAVQQINKFLAQFGDDYQKAFDAIYVKGVNPQEYFTVANKISNFAELDLTKEENQISVIRQTLADQGLEHEDIDAEVERLKNYGDLEVASQRYHKILVKKEGTKLAQMEQESQQKLQAQAESKRQYITNVNTVLQNKLKNKEFDGIPINPKLAQELQDFLITDKYRLPSGETLSEFDKKILDLKRPENHELKVKVALLLKTLEKDPTLSTIQKAGLSKTSNKVFEELTKHNEKVKPSKTKKTTEPTSWFS